MGREDAISCIAPLGPTVCVKSYMYLGKHVLGFQDTPYLISSIICMYMYTSYPPLQTARFRKLRQHTLLLSTWNETKQNVLGSFLFYMERAGTKCIRKNKK